MENPETVEGVEHPLGAAVPEGGLTVDVPPADVVAGAVEVVGADDVEVGGAGAAPGKHWLLIVVSSPRDK